MRDILLVDLDDTLLDFSRGEKEALEKVFDAYNIDNLEENKNKYYQINIDYWKKYENHQIERDKLLGQRWVDFFNLFNQDVDGDKVNDLYFSYLSQNAYLIKNSLEFCKRCEEKGYQILIVTNGVGLVQNPRIEKCGLKKYFKKIYLSEKIGYNKPDIEFFYSILKDYKEKERMIIIGDSLSSDIQGGINFQIPTIWFNPNKLKSDKPDYQVEDLLDIFNILEEV